MSTPSRFLSVKNFERFQHYKERRPPWIKLYQEVLEDYAFTRLQDASKAHLVAIWLLASRYENRIPYDAQWIATAIHATTAVDIAGLVSAGFLVISGAGQDASDVLAERTQDAMPEKEREVEKEVEKKERKRPARAPDDRPATPDEQAVLAHYTAVHPKRRPGQKEVGVVRRALALGYTVAELCGAIDGNAGDPWHQEKGKHELSYVLRDNEHIDDFRLRVEATAPKPAVDPLTGLPNLHGLQVLVGGRAA